MKRQIMDDAFEVLKPPLLPKDYAKACKQRR